MLGLLQGGERTAGKQSRRRAQRCSQLSSHQEDEEPLSFPLSPPPHVHSTGRCEVAESSLSSFLSCWSTGFPGSVLFSALKEGLSSWESLLRTEQDEGVHCSTILYLRMAGRAIVLDHHGVFSSSIGCGLWNKDNSSVLVLGGPQLQGEGCGPAPGVRKGGWGGETHMITVTWGTCSEPTHGPQFQPTYIGF